MAILFDIGFRLDDKELKPKLESIQRDLSNALSVGAKNGGLSEDLAKAANQAKILQNALAKATSEKGTSYLTLNKELHKAGVTAAQMKADLAAGGEQFNASLREVNKALALSNKYSITLNSRLKEAARVLTQSFKYSAAQMIFRFITGKIRETINWVKQLNKEMVNIQVVTGKTGDEMEKVAESTIKAAKALRVSAKEYAEAAFIYYQQGLGDEEVARRTEITIKAAKAAGQSVSEMSQQLTAVWNTYNMQADEQARAASVGAKLAATTAVEFKDIAEAMQLSASAASTMGVSYDSLASIIATVGTVTQQSASIIGNAYKTIFSRFEQLKSDGSDGEVTLNRVSAQLADLGVHVLDNAGELKDLDTVINEVGNSWDDYTQKQKIAIAELVGGTRQYTQFLALMNNFDDYQKNLKVAKSETGAETLEQQYNTALESVSEKAARAGETWSRAFSQLIDEDMIKSFYDTIRNLGELVEGLLKSVGGLPGILRIVGVLLSSKIGPAVNRAKLDIQDTAITLARSKQVSATRREAMAITDTKKDARQLQLKDEELVRQSKATGADNSAERESLTIQMQKLPVLQRIRLCAENIDFSMRSANAQEKEALKTKKESLALLQKEYEDSVELVAEKRKALQEDQKRYDINYQNAKRQVREKEKNLPDEDAIVAEKLKLEETKEKHESDKQSKAQEIADKQKVVAQKTAEIAQRRESLNTAKAAAEEEEKSLPDNAIKTLEELEKKKAELEKKRKEIEAAKAKSSEDYKALSKEEKTPEIQKAHRQELAQFNAELGKVKKEEAALKPDEDRLLQKRDIAEEEAAIAEEEAALESAKEEVIALQKELEDLNNVNFTELENHIKELEKDFNEATEALREAKKELAGYETKSFDTASGDKEAKTTKAEATKAYQEGTLKTEQADLEITRLNNKKLNAAPEDQAKIDKQIAEQQAIKRQSIQDIVAGAGYAFTKEDFADEYFEASQAAIARLEELGLSFEETADGVVELKGLEEVAVSNYKEIEEQVRTILSETGRIDASAAEKGRELYLSRVQAENKEAAIANAVVETDIVTGVKTEGNPQKQKRSRKTAPATEETPEETAPVAEAPKENNVVHKSQQEEQNYSEVEITSQDTAVETPEVEIDTDTFDAEQAVGEKETSPVDTTDYATIEQTTQPEIEVAAPEVIVDVQAPAAGYSEEYLGDQGALGNLTAAIESNTDAVTEMYTAQEDAADVKAEAEEYQGEVKLPEFQGQIEDTGISAQEAAAGLDAVANSAEEVAATQSEQKKLVYDKEQRTESRKDIEVGHRISNGGFDYSDLKTGDLADKMLYAADNGIDITPIIDKLLPALEGQEVSIEEIDKAIEGKTVEEIKPLMEELKQIIQLKRDEEAAKQQMADVEDSFENPYRERSREDFQVPKDNIFHRKEYNNFMDEYSGTLVDTGNKIQDFALRTEGKDSQDEIAELDAKTSEALFSGDLELAERLAKQAEAKKREASKTYKEVAEIMDAIEEASSPEELDELYDKLKDIAEGLKEVAEAQEAVEETPEPKEVERAVKEEPEKASNEASEEAPKEKAPETPAPEVPEVPEGEDKSPNPLANISLDEVTQLTQGIVQLYGAFATAGAAIGSFSKALKEGDMTTTEVLGSVIGLASTIGMMIPQITAGYRTLAETKLFNNLVSKAQNSQTTKNIAGFLAEKLAKLGLVGAENADTAATIANTAAKIASLGIIGLIIAAVIALTVVIVKLAQHIQSISPEGQFKKAQQLSEDLGKSLEEATAKADALRQSMENYDSAKDKLNDCTQGTEEFKEALDEANKAALNVLDSIELVNGEKLSDFYTRDEKTGEIILNKDKIAEKQAFLDDREDAAEMANSFGKANLAEKSAANQLNKLQGIQTIGYTADGQEIHNAHVDRSGKDSLGNVLFENIDNLKNLDDGDLVQKLRDLGYYVEKGTADFENLRNTINSLATSTEAANDSMEMMARVQADENFSGEKAEYRAYAAREAAQDQKEIYDEIIATASKKNGWKTEDENGRNLIERYNAATGNNYTIDKVKGDKDNRSYNLVDGKGNKLEKVSLETIAAEIAAAEALEDMTGSIKEAKEALGNLTGSAKDAAVNYLNNGNLNNLSPQQLDALKNKAENGTDEEKEALMTVFEDMESLNAAVQSSLDAITHGADGMVSAVQDAYNKAFLVEDGEGGYKADENSAISADQSKAIADMMETAFGNGGQEMLDKFTGVLEGFETPEEMTQFINSLNNINWAGPDVSRLAAELEPLCDSAEEAAEMAEYLSKALYQQAEVTLESAQATYESLHKIRQSLDDYSVISDEDFKTLDEAGIAVDDYFTTMADGTHMLTGDAKELKSIIDGISFANYQQLVDQNTESASVLSGGLNYTNEQLKSAATDDTNLQNVQLEALRQNGMDAAHIEEIKGDAEAIAKAIEEASINSETIRNMFMEASENAKKAAEALETAQFQTRVEDSGLDFEETENYAKRLADAYGLTTQQARDLAIQNSRLDKGINALNDDIEGFKKALTDTNRNSLEWSKTMDKLKDELADVFNIGDASMLSDATAEAILNSEDLTKALDGDIEALDRMRGMVTKDVGNSIFDKVKEKAEEAKWAYENIAADAPEDLTTNLQNSLADANANLESFTQHWNDLQSYLDGGLHCSTEEFDTAMNGMIEASHMTYEEITSLLGSMGVSAKIHTTYTEEEHDIPIIREKKEISNVVKGEDGLPTTWETATTSWTEGFEKHTETVPTYTVETASGDFKSGGDLNASTSNIGGKAQVSHGATTSGKASGGGGSSKSAKPVDNHKRYDNIQHAIDNMTRSAERYKSAADDAWGNKKVANLEAYAKKLQAVGKEYNKLYQEARSYYAADSAALNGSLANIGMSAQYNSDGTVANSEQIQKAWDSWANSRLGDDDAQDYAKEQLELLDKVNESAEKANEAFDQAIENVRAYVSARLEAISYKIEFEIGIDEQEIKEIEFLIDCMGELGTASGKALKEMRKVFNEQQDEVKLSLKGAQDALTFLNDLSDPANQAEFKSTFGDEIWEKYINGNGGMPAEVMEYLEDQRSTLIDQMSALVQTARDMFQNYLDAIQLYIDEFDRAIDRIETQNAQLEMYTKLLEVTGKASTKEGREARKQIAQQQVDNNLISLKANKAKVDMLQQQYDESEKRLDDFLKKYGDPSTYDEATAVAYNNLKNTTDELQDQLEAENQNLISAANDTMDAICEAINAGAEVIQEELMADLGGVATSLSSFQDLYKSQYDVQHFYLDEYDKNYNLNKLEHEISQQIKDIQDPSRLAEYDQMLDNINAKRAEGVNLTQKDIDILNAEFELQKLYDEYENAKNAKNSMRLSRDASGNYSYVYSNTSGDEEEIGQKIQDQLYNIKKLHEEATDEMQDLWVSTWTEMNEYISQIDQLKYETDDRYAQEVDLRLKIYNERLAQFSSAATTYMEGYEYNFAESALGIITDCTSMEEAHQKYTDKSAEYNQKLKDNADQYRDKIDEVCEAVDVDYETLAEDIMDHTQAMSDANDELGQHITDMADQASEALGEMGDELTDFTDSFVSDFQEMWQAVQDLIDQLKAFEQEVATASNVDMSGLSNAASAAMSSYSGGGSSSSSGSSSGLSGTSSVKDLQEYLNKNYGTNLAVDGAYGPATKAAVEKMQSSLGVKVDGLYGSKTWDAEESRVEKTSGIAGSIPKPIYKTGGVADFTGPAWLDGTPTQPELVLNAEDTQNMLKAVEIIREVKETSPEQSSNALDEIKKFDTGGYTGDWGTSDGKLAVLHQKEMVLNATDTEHILQAVKMVRAVVESQSNVLRTENISVAQQPVANNITQPVAQDVKIEASFPNVSVAAEIEEALNNIVNEAVQYVSKR